MLKFLVLSFLFGASLSLHMEDVASLRQSDYVKYCSGTGCKQTEYCQLPVAAGGVCVADTAACEGEWNNYYKTYNNWCEGNCYCMQKCRPKPECSTIGGYCIRRDQICASGEVKKDCGCKTRNQCSCCVPIKNAGKLTC